MQGDGIRAAADTSAEIRAEAGDSAKVNSKNLGDKVTEAADKKVTVTMDFNKDTNEFEVTAGGKTRSFTLEEYRTGGASGLLDADLDKFFKETMDPEVYKNSVGNNKALQDLLKSLKDSVSEDRPNVLEQNRLLQGKLPADRSKAIQSTIYDIDTKSPNATKAVKDLNKKMASGAVTTAEYPGELDKIKKKYPKEVEIMETEMDANPDTKKIKDELAKGDAEQSWGSFAKENFGNILIGGLAISAVLLTYYVIEHHKNEMNGCWYIPNKSGGGDAQKTKVSDFTCNSSDQESTTGSTSASTGLGVPVVSCKCGKNTDSGDCASCCKCGDGGQDCSHGTFQCVKANAGDATADLFDGFIGDIGGVLSKILKVLFGLLKWVLLLALVALAILIIFKVGKAIFEKMTGKKKGAPPKPGEKGKPGGAAKPGEKGKPGGAAKPGEKGKPGAVAKVTVKVPAGAAAVPAAARRPPARRTRAPPEKSVSQKKAACRSKGLVYSSSTGRCRTGR